MNQQRRQPAPSPGWNALAIGMGSLFVVGLVLLGLAVARPAALVRLGSLTDYTNSRAWWPIGVQVLLGVGAFLVFFWPRRQQHRSFSLLATAGLAATTISLGLVSYWRCAGNQSPFWTPLTWALGLIVGSVADPFGKGGGCPAAPPLALQSARLFGPFLLVITALGVLSTLFRAQNDRLRVRFAPSLVVLVGLTEDAVGLLRRLAASAPLRTTLAVLTEDAGSPLVTTAREIGARVVVVDLDDRDALPILLLARGRFKVRTLYAVSAEVSANLRWAARVRQVADAANRTGADLPTRLIVRIDEPWQAEYWRRTNAYRTPAPETSTGARWISDALSVYEVTAARILDQISQGHHDRLVLVGNSALSLAICAEMAHREREAALLGSPPQPSFTELVLFGADAEALRQQHRLRQERFGNSAALDAITVVAEEATDANLSRLLAAAAQPALVLAADPAQLRPQPATYLAALHPGWTVFDWIAGTAGASGTPIMERLYQFGLTLDAPEHWPVDSWERAARIVHERYLRLHVPTPDPNVASHRSWDAGLGSFVKDSNVRLVVTALASAEAVGRSWGPLASAGAPTAPSPLDESQLDRMAELEHASWVRYHQDNRWRHGTPRDDVRRVHPALLPWSTLDPENRQKARHNVVDALATLAGLGYRSVPAPPNGSATEAGWTAFTRTGEVQANRTQQPWTWTNEAGEVMQAALGDWRLTAPDGRSWSVEPDIFASTYAQVAGDRYRRTGRVVARPAVAGETVTSLEGSQEAASGDWVVRGVRGELWVVSAEHFAANYQPRPG